MTRHWDLSRVQAEQLTAHIQASVSIGRFHQGASCKALLCNAIRTSDKNLPIRNNILHNKHFDKKFVAGAMARFSHRRNL